MPALHGLPQALRRLRTRKGFRSLAAGEKATGVSTSNLSRYETGKASPDLRTLERLLDGYGATLSELGAEVDNGGREQAEVSKLLGHSGALQDLIKQMIDEALEARSERD